MPDSNRFKMGVLAAATILIAALSACSSSAPRESADQPVEFKAQIQADSITGDRHRGLELRVLTVDDSGDRVARVLAKFEQDHGVIDDAAYQIWREWGLRWVVVPIDQLDAVIAAQDLTQAMQIRWMGEFPQWRAIIRTGAINNRAVRIGEASDGVERTLHGRPRLLGRVWTSPELTDSGVVTRLHMDIAVQITRPAKRNQWEGVGHFTALDEGHLIDELRMSLSLDSSQALVLVGEDPSVRWIEVDEAEPSSVVVSTGDGLGPSSPGPRTLGQSMLSTPGTGSVAPENRYVAPKKVLLILVPKAEGRYRLLGPTSMNSSQNSSNTQGGTP